MTARTKTKRMWGIFNPDNGRPEMACDEPRVARESQQTAIRLTGRPYYIQVGTFVYDYRPRKKPRK